ncbi:MAG: acetoacetate metabolism regulatory protein AtoC [bacterium]|nr:MAG: acetoacetate metabolism regulatory protein AtoC [bacterium]
MTPKIITVDDDINTLKSIEELLGLKKCKVFPHLTTGDAIRNLKGIGPDLAIIDFFMPDMTGVELMEKFHATEPELPVIILTASREVKTAVEAIRAGAFHYLIKPLQPDELFSTIDKILSQLRLKEENRRLRNELSGKYRFENIIGCSGALREVFAILGYAIKTKSTILITGRSGTGKELIARAVHFNSDRREKPFIRVNCAAIPESMLEAELFGIEKNVATGVAERPGKFELAHTGSIFLDGIGEMSPTTQSKVLRVLQERELERIGSSRSLKVDIRVIAATNQNLPEAIKEKKFREDLYYRLNVFHINLPTLSERTEDIPLLAEHFLEKYCEKNGMPLKTINPEAMDYLCARVWPGNIRELENAMERAVGICDSGAITVRDFENPFSIQPAAETGMVSEPTNSRNLDGMVEDYERRLLSEALERNRWKQNHTAKELGISERSIWYKIKKLGIDIGKSSGDV